MGMNISLVCSSSKQFFEFANEYKVRPYALNIKRKFSPFADLKAIYILSRILKKEKIEIVIGHTPKGALISMIAAKIVGTKRRIYFRHGIFYETSNGIKKCILRHIEKLTSYCANLIVCVSESVLNLSITDNLNPSFKNILLNSGSCNGINFEYFNRKNLVDEDLFSLKAVNKINNDDFVVGFVGRLVIDKGIKELLIAWKIVSTRHPNAKLLLIGPYEKRNGLSKDLILHIKNDPSIINIDYVIDVRPYYALMDIFILPSYREGFPTVVLEASAMLLPVITTRSTGCIDSIVENVTGIYTSLDENDICNSIEYYMEFPEMVKRHGMNGRNRIIHDFGQIDIWKEIEDKLYFN